MKKRKVFITQEKKKFLYRIERANQGHTKSCLKLLQAAYGQRGKTRHLLLQVKSDSFIFITVIILQKS